MAIFGNRNIGNQAFELGNIDFGNKRDLFLGNKEIKRFISEKQANESPI